MVSVMMDCRVDDCGQNKDLDGRRGNNSFPLSGDLLEPGRGVLIGREQGRPCSRLRV